MRPITVIFDIKNCFQWVPVNYIHAYVRQKQIHHFHRKKKDEFEINFERIAHVKMRNHCRPADHFSNVN